LASRLSAPVKPVARPQTGPRQGRLEGAIHGSGNDGEALYVMVMTDKNTHALAKFDLTDRTAQEFLAQYDDLLRSFYLGGDIADLDIQAWFEGTFQPNETLSWGGVIPKEILVAKSADCWKQGHEFRL
jgi:hypothetical protein